jgi:chemotaxis protein MotB
MGFVSRRTTADHSDSSWLITLSDLTLLLLCFLVVWYVKRQAQDTIPSKPETPSGMTHQHSHGKELRSNTGTDNWMTLKDDIVKFVSDAGMRDDIDIELEAEEVRISFKDSISFASGKAELNVRALPVLERVAVAAVSEPTMYLRIDGHTDDRPISTPEFPSNWELSSARASRVARRLIQRGVDPKRIEVNGYADYRPRTANEEGSGRGANRRVEISLLRKNRQKHSQIATSATTK